MIKRLIDLVGAVCGIAIASPLMLTSGDSCQSQSWAVPYLLCSNAARVLWGEPFRLYNFRSMHECAGRRKRFEPTKHA